MKVELQDMLSCFLLMKLKDDNTFFSKKYGQWDVPGGFLELGEHPEAGLQREMREELGVEIEILEMLGIFMDHYCQAGKKTGDSTLNICYLAKIKSGKPKPSSDVAAYKWFKRSEIPIKKIAFKNGQAMIAAWLKYTQL